MDESVISSLPLFATLPHSAIEQLARALRPHEAPAHTLLFFEGQTGDRFYILIEGEVEIIKALGTDAERLLAVRGSGSLVGEMSLFSEDHRHTASVRARTPLQLLELTHADFDALLHSQPGLVYELVRTLTARLTESENLTIRDLLEKNRQLRQAYHELEAAQAQLIEKEKLEAELNVARQIQRSILPHAMPQVPGYDFGVVMEPMHKVGGDLFDFIPLDGGRLGITVGDVSDHGVPAAIFMALTYSLLRAEASRTPLLGEAIGTVNRHLLKMNESGMFVTLLYGILDSATGQFSYVRAGHERPLLLNARRETIEVGYGPGQILGLFSDPILDEQTVKLEPGSLLVLYTDGVTEASDRTGEQFGRERLQAVLRTSAPASAQEACEAVYAAVRAHRGDQVVDDDALLVAVRAT